MPPTTRARTTTQSHQRLLAGSAAEESRVPRSGSSMESRWPIRSLLSIKGNGSDVPSESFGQDWGYILRGPPPNLLAYRKNRPAHRLDGFGGQMVTKPAHWMGGLQGLAGMRESHGNGASLCAFLGGI